MTTDVANIVRHLADRFIQTPVGETVEYDELSAAIGQDVLGQRLRPLIYRALKLAEEEAGAKFENKTRLGYRRLPSAELIKIGQHARRKVRSVAKRANKGISAGMRVANDLTPEQVNALLREQSALGVFEMFSKDANLPKVEMTDKRPLTPGQAARQFLETVGGVPSKKIS